MGVLIFMDNVFSYTGFLISKSDISVHSCPFVSVNDSPERFWFPSKLRHVAADSWNIIKLVSLVPRTPEKNYQTILLVTVVLVLRNIVLCSLLCII